MRNKKATAFLNRKSYIIAAVIMIVAAFGMIGLYYSQQDKKQEEQLAKEQKALVQQAKAEDEAKENALREKAEAAAQAAQKEKEKAAKKEKEKETEKETEQEKEEETEAVSGIIAPQEDNFLDEPAVISDAVNTAPIPEPDFHFDATNLTWPLQGNVILNYSMDQTVYFATLDQYKYNPAVIIQAEVNSPVNAVAEGMVTSIETNEETGTVLTVDMGDGYSARYGQLKEIPKNQGDYVENGEVLGYVNEPTKYYSLEGANLYFQLLKDGAPVDPMEYFE